MQIKTLSKRKGRFILYDCFFDDDYNSSIEKFFKEGLVIIDLKRNYETTSIIYTALHEKFRELSNGEEIPFYDIATTLQDKDIIYIEDLDGLPFASADYFPVLKEPTFETTQEELTDVW